VRSVVAALAGDMAAADQVQLELPETGVCSTQFDEASSGCCGGGETGSRPIAAIAAAGMTSALTAATAAAGTTAGSCGTPSCGGAPKEREDACCGLDEKIKDAGGTGCGSEASKTATAQAISAACCR
jgi:hypothetical protein